LINLNTLVGIGFSSIFDLIYLSFTNVEFENISGVEEAFMGALELDWERSSGLIDDEARWASESNVFLHVLGIGNSSGVETHLVVEDATAHIDGAFFSLLNGIDHARLLGDNFYHFHLLKVVSETDTNVSEVFMGKLAKLFLQFEEETVSIHKFFHHVLVWGLLVLFEASVTNENFVVLTEWR
jgi:hypothetical protein